MEGLGMRQATTPLRPVKRPRLLQAQRRKYDSVPHSANGGAAWPFSTPGATWEVKSRVQLLPLSEPFVLTFSFLFHGCELNKTCNSFTVIASAVYACDITAKSCQSPKSRTGRYTDATPSPLSPCLCGVP